MTTFACAWAVCAVLRFCHSPAAPAVPCKGFVLRPGSCSNLSSLAQRRNRFLRPVYDQVMIGL